MTTTTTVAPRRDRLRAAYVRLDEAQAVRDAYHAVLTRRLDEQAMARRFGDPDWVARSGREVRAARLQLEFADAALTAAVRAVDKLEA